MCPYLSKEKRIFANGFMGNIVNTMGATVFNPVQQHLLMMFAFDGSEERLKEVKTVLFQYFQKKWMSGWMNYGIQGSWIRESWTNCVPNIYAQS